MPKPVSLLNMPLYSFLFAFPGFFTIDRYGRRTLLMVTFPLMGIFLLMTGFAFFIPGETSPARVGVVALGIYLYVRRAPCSTLH
jgi:hypothetical protein